VPPLRTLHKGVNHVSFAAPTLAALISSGVPFLSALFAEYLANTPGPTHSASLSTLTLLGQAHVFFLAFSVRPRRAGPSPLRSASARRRGRGTCPRPAARAPPRPAPRAPPAWARAGCLSTSRRAGPRRPQTQSRSSRRWPRLANHVTPPPCGARTGPAGPAASPASAGHATGDVVLRSRFPPAVVVTVVGGSEGGRDSRPSSFSCTARSATQTANS
jgi:hypothetical protein